MAVIKLFIHQLLFDGFIISGHSFWFLFNSAIFLGFLLLVVVCLFHRKIKRVSDLFFFTLPSFCFVVIGTYFYNQLFPFTRIHTFIFLLLLMVVSGGWFIYSHGFVSWSSLCQSKKLKSFLITSGKYCLLFFTLVILFSLNTFQNRLPYTANAYDYTAHNNFILSFQRESVVSYMGGFQLIAYPIGIHTFLAFLNSIILMPVIAPWEMAGYLVAFFAVGLIAYFRRRGHSLWLVMPLILCPTFTFVFYEDHINTFAALIPLFLIFEFIAIHLKIKLSTWEKSKWLYLMILMLSTFIIYSYSLFLALPLIVVFFIICFFSDQAVMRICLRKWRVLVVVLVMATAGLGYGFYQLMPSIAVIYQASMGQHELENRQFTLLNLLGIQHYRAYDGVWRLEVLPLQAGSVIFWLLVLSGCLFTSKRSSADKKLTCLVILAMFFWLIIVNLLIPSSYIVARTYAYTFIMLLVGIAHLYPGALVGWRQYALPVVSILASVGFMIFIWGDLTRNINFRTLDARVDESDALALQEIIPDGSQVVSSHNIHLSHMLKFFLFDHSRWHINPNLSEDISEYDLSDSGYLIAHYQPYYDNYPREFLTPVYDNREKDYVVFRVHNYQVPLTLPTTYKRYFNQATFDQINWDEVIVMLGFNNQEKQSCYFYGRGSEIKNFIQQQINQSEVGEFLLTYFYTYNTNAFGDQFYNYCEAEIKWQVPFIQVSENRVATVAAKIAPLSLPDGQQ